jgi:hypothetical protein
MAIDFEDPTTWDQPLTEADAISLGIWAINTLMNPDGSTDAQFSVLDFMGDGAVEKLADLRKTLIKKDD